MCEDYLVKPGWAAFKIFHDEGKNPQSRVFSDGVYYSFNHGRLSYFNIQDQGVGEGVWHPVANKIDTDWPLTNYNIDRFGAFGLTTSEKLTVYKYPPVMRKF